MPPSPPSTPSPEAAEALAELPADEAISRLLAEHGPKIYNLALRMCRNPHQAEDVVQETFLQAYRKWDQFEGRSNPSTWLYTIATRLCYRMLRKRAGEPQRMASLQELLPFDGGAVPDLPGHDEPHQLDIQIRTEAKEHIEHAITRLPAPFRMPLILKEILGLPVADVAEILGVKQATVKTRLHRARHVLRDELSGHLPKRDAPPPAYSKRVCMDLLRSKQEALDRGARFPIPQAEMCDRCRAVFASMDLSQEVCEELGDQTLPDRLRELILADIAEQTQ